MLDHISGKIKLIPDYLSRGSVDETIGLMKVRRGIELMRVKLGAS